MANHQKIGTSLNALALCLMPCTFLELAMFLSLLMPQGFTLGEIREYFFKVFVGLEEFKFIAENFEEILFYSCIVQGFVCIGILYFGVRHYRDYFRLPTLLLLALGGIMGMVSLFIFVYFKLTFNLTPAPLWPR